MCYFGSLPEYVIEISNVQIRNCIIKLQRKKIKNDYRVYFEENTYII